MEAGRAIVREEGADALTLRKVASRAGVSSAAPYRHFHDKEALVAEVMRSGFAALREALAPCDGAAPLDRMHAIGHAYIAFAVREPSLYRLMFGPAVARRGAHADLARAERAAHEPILDALRCAKAADMIGEDLRSAAVTMRCVMHGLASLIADGQVASADAETLTETIMRVVDEGMLA